MNTPINTAVYTDFQGLTDLRREAGSNSQEALEKVAKQFEALFTQMMLKSMREASVGDGLFDNDQSRMYQDLYDKQIAVELSSKQGLGLADLLVQQMRGETAAASGSVEGQRDEGGNFAVPQRASNLEFIPAVVQESPAASPSNEASFAKPESFINDLWPHAERAAKELGTEPQALLAQAALETGWGNATLRHADGSSSHNLFNIKADARWDGATVAKRTLEFEQGVGIRTLATFRSYGSYEESFNDYVQFLKSNPRYAPALKEAADPEAFVTGLQDAGYATDPDYASKINEIMSRDAFVSSTLKNRGERTLS